MCSVSPGTGFAGTHDQHPSGFALNRPEESGIGTILNRQCTCGRVCRLVLPVHLVRVRRSRLSGTSADCGGLRFPSHGNRHRRIHFGLPWEAGVDALMVYFSGNSGLISGGRELY